MGGAYITYGRSEKCIQYFIGKPEGKRPLGRPWCIWEDNIRMDLKETGWEGGDYMQPVQWVAVVNTVMNFRFP